MDRRVVAGLAGLVLVGCVRPSPAQTDRGKDPSGQPPVGFVPLRSIGDSINNLSDDPSTVPMASPAVPTSPIGTGPAATIPRAPVSTSPISMTPLEPIDRSIRADYRQRGVVSMFRRARPQAAPVPRTMPTSEVAPRVALPAFPPVPVASAAPAPETSDLLMPGPPAPAGRPAPFAGQVPEMPRLQAEPAPAPNPDAVPGAGRPAPLADELPRSARPRTRPDDRPPAPRPRAQFSNAPAFHQAEVATSAAPISIPTDPPSIPPPETFEMPPPPGLEAIPPPGLEAAPPPGLEAAPPPPIGTDPLQGMAPPPTVPPAVLPEPAPAPAPAATLATPISDPEVRRASGDEIAILTKKPEQTREPAYVPLRAAASVGDEIITINELDAIVEEKYREIPPEQRQSMSKQEKVFVANQIGANALQHLIDQSLVIQEAKREMKNPKAQTTFNDYVENLWKETELPPLLRKTASANVYELKIKLAQQGKSYDSLKETFRKKTLSRDYMSAKIHNKITCDVVQQRAYYNAHLDDFVQPARMTWREIEVSFAKHPSRAAARKKAEEVLARLLHNGDFDAIARSFSDGPTASKGGLYPDMQPGSYGIPVVNDALNQLPVGQVSPILEAPNSFHIVRVDVRREKGPLRFDEVQEKVRNHVLEQNYLDAVEAYIAKLRSKTLVRTMFDAAESDPTIALRKGASAKAASGRAPDR